MLAGAYKNDLKTRLFFKELVGPHFHFTAYGIDWLEEHWYKGKPPTYNEFAVFWQKEHERRVHKPETPKKEWAYLNFLQHYKEKNPDAPKNEMLDAWARERKNAVYSVMTLLRKGRFVDPIY